MTNSDTTYNDLALAALQLARVELDAARQKFGSFASAHEGYAVLLEEVDELWQAIKHGSNDEVRAEAIQVAAMAAALVIECCGLELGGSIVRGEIRVERRT